MAKLWHQIGRRGATLLLFSLVDLTLSYSMFSITPAVAKASYQGHQLMFPLQAWGYMWLLAALVLAINAFRRDDRLGFAVAMGVKVVWASGFFISYIIFGIPRAVIGACLWTFFAAWLFLIAGWPEAAKDHHVDD